SIAGGNLNPGDPRGHATFYFHIQTISSLTIRYRGGNGGGSQDPGDQYIWIGDISGISTTQAVISSFGAFADAGRTVVEWETASEVGTLGFYLERLDEAAGGYEPLNDRLLPGLLHSPQGGIYRYVDEGAWPGESYTYKLIEVENSGRKRLHGPYTVLVQEEAPAFSGNRNARSAKSAEPAAYSRRPHETPPAKQARVKARKEIPRTTGNRARTAAGPNTVKIAVAENGLYSLTDTEIADALGAGVADVRKWIKNKKLRLRVRGQNVAWAAAEDNMGLSFYGQAIESIYTRENIYWLDKAPGKKMGKVRGNGPAPSSGGETFTETGRVEEDNWAQTVLFDDPGDDFWLWDYIFSGNPSMGTKTFPLPIEEADSGAEGVLTVHLQGQSNTDHHVKVSLNGAVAEGWWSGATAHALELRGLIFQEGENTVEVTGLLDTGAPYSLFYVDSFDYTCRRYYRARNNRLFVKGEQNQVVTISGFTDPDIQLYELTNPNKPKIVRAVTLDEMDGEHRVSFRPRGAETLYLALTSNAIGPPLAIMVDSPSNLKQRRNDIAYVVIAPSELKAAAQSLADYRRGDGVGTIVVDLEDIYDEFNDGISSPLAIRDFLRYAYKKWRGVSRVVLAGEGTYDYKNNQGAGDNLIPVMMASTPHGLFAADNRFVDATGDDGVPEMAIGRLPAVTNAELDAMIEKIINYESGPGGAWSTKVMMLADNPDAAGDFPADSDDVAAILPDGYYTRKIYLPDYASVAAARSDVTAEFEAGALLVNFIGHGGLDRLNKDGMLLTADASSLSNGERLPVVTAMTCVVGRFSLPGFDSLGEALLLNGQGGAAAVWAPTGLSGNAMAKILDEEFFRIVFEDGEKVLGEAILKALQAYSNRGGAPDTLDIYNLLGDPGMRIK
ncbi:MAG: hypothetical protein GY859_37650, partial [Desulfobacterales bacterium]|nr:hypothetical protein [Desulfobacterales bacterium]